MGIRKNVQVFGKTLQQLRTKWRVKRVITNKKIMSKFCLILLVVWMLQASRACEDDNEEELLVRQQSDEYFAKAYGFTADTWNTLYNKPSPRLPGKRKRQA
jgi:hypothetical protein